MGRYRDLEAQRWKGGGYLPGGRLGNVLNQRQLWRAVGQMVRNYGRGRMPALARHVLPVVASRALVKYSKPSKKKRVRKYPKALRKTGWYQGKRRVPQKDCYQVKGRKGRRSHYK